MASQAVGLALGVEIPESLCLDHAKVGLALVVEEEAVLRVVLEPSSLLPAGLGGFPGDQPPGSRLEGACARLPAERSGSSRLGRWSEVRVLFRGLPGRFLDDLPTQLIWVARAFRARWHDAIVAHRADAYGGAEYAN